MGLNPNLLYLVGRNASSERGRAWTIDPSNFGGGFTQIKEFNEGGYTQCMGCVVHEGKLWVARAYGTTDGAVSYFDGSTWTDDITWGSTGKATDIVVFDDELYVMKRISGTQCEVVKRTGPGTWTNVLTITVNSTDPGGGLQVIKGSGGTEYLIAWPYTGFNASQHRFHFTTDGSSWTAASTTGLPSAWQQFSYVHWDETNSVYRLKYYNIDVDLTSATLGGAWSAGAATGHVAPGRAWGDVYTDVDGDIFCAPNADTDVRKFSGGSWSDKHALGAASQVDITSRASWIEWNGTVYLACNALDGKIVSYVEGTDTWATEASAPSQQDFTGIAGPGRSPMRIFRHQIMRDSDGQAAITQDHHDPLIGHPSAVDFSNMVDDSLAGPPGSETAGDTFVIDGSPTGQWVGFADTNVVVALVDNPSAFADWALVEAALGDGDQMRVSSSPGAGASFTSYADQIMLYDLGTTSWIDAVDLVPGAMCVGRDANDAVSYKDIMMYDGSTWISVSTVMAIAAGDNALEISGSELSHIDSMGHGQDTVAYMIYSDIDQSGNDPVAASYTGFAVIANNCNTFVDGQVYYSDGSTWTQLTSNALTTGARVISAATVEAACGMTANQIQTLVATGNFGSGSDWTKVTPHLGDIAYVGQPEQNANTSIYERLSAIWDGSVWQPMGKWVANLDGEGIGVDSISRLKVNVKTNAGLAITNDELHAVAETSAGIGNQPTATDQLITKSAMDAYLQGLAWKEPTAVLRILSDADQSGTPPTAGSIGEAWVVNDWSDVNNGTATGTFTAATKELSDSVYTFQASDIGDFVIVKTGNNIGVHEITSINAGAAVFSGSTIVDEASVTWRQSDTYKDGDIVEWDGNSWVAVVDQVDAEVADGTRVVVHESGAGGAFTGEEENLGTYDATGDSWSFDTAEDGDAVMIYGDNSYYADNAYTYDGTNWIQFSKVIYTPGFGLDLAGNQFSFDMLISTWADKASGTTWDTGLASTVDGDKMHIFRNGVLQRKVAAAPGDGEYTWSAGTATFGTGFGPATEVVYAWGPGV